MPRKVPRKPKATTERRPPRAPSFLNEVQKEFIVDRLAEYDTLKQVRTAFQERFGWEVLTATVEHYDPTRSGSKRLAKRLVARFNERREDFKTLLDQIPLANRATRLKERSSIFHRQSQKGNDRMALEVLNTIQAEMNDVERAKPRGGINIGVQGPGGRFGVSLSTELPGSDLIDALFEEMSPQVQQPSAPAPMILQHTPAPAAAAQVPPAHTASSYSPAAYPPAATEDAFFDDFPAGMR